MRGFLISILCVSIIIISHEAFAIDYYRRTYPKLSETTHLVVYKEATKLYDLLIEMQRKEILPAKRIVKHVGGEGLKWVFNDFDLSLEKSFHTTFPQIKNIDVPHANTNGAILAGDNNDNVIKNVHGNVTIIGNGGADKIDSSHGNDIIEAGAGNDIIKAGLGADILVFNKKWGKDTINKSCSTSKKRPKDSEKLWSWEFNNFIVFGKGVYPNDMEWKNKLKLVNIKTGDSITFDSANSCCFNFVYYEENGKLRKNDKELQYQKGLSYEKDIKNKEKSLSDADVQSAIKWYRKAAEQGHLKAINRLTTLLLKTGKTEKELQESVKWLIKSGKENTFDKWLSSAKKDYPVKQYMIRYFRRHRSLEK